MKFIVTFARHDLVAESDIRILHCKTYNHSIINNNNIGTGVDLTRLTEAIYFTFKQSIFLFIGNYSWETDKHYQYYQQIFVNILTSAKVLLNTYVRISF